MIVFHFLGLALAALIAYASIKSLTGPTSNIEFGVYGLLLSVLLVIGILIARKQRREITKRNKHYKELEMQSLRQQGIELSRLERFGRWLDDQFTFQWEKDLRAKQAHGPRAPKPPEAIEFADNRAVRVCIGTSIFILILGLIFPETGSQALGILGIPINWASNLVPSINKLASVSTMPQLVSGYLGMIALAIPILPLILLSQDPIKSRGHFLLLDAVESKLLSCLRLCAWGLIFPIALTWLFWEFPVTVRLGADTGRGQILLHLMMTNRFALSACGAFIFFTITTFLFFGLTMTIGAMVGFIRKS